MVCDTRESTTCLDYSRQKKRCCLKLGARGTAAGVDPQKAALAAEAARNREGHRPDACIYSQSC